YDADIWVNAVKRSFYSTGFATEMGYTSAPGSLGRKDENVISDPRYFTGLLDKFYFWNRSISQEEVDLLFYENGLSSIDESTLDRNNILTFPNPTSGILQIKLPQGFTLENARIISVEGKLVKDINSFEGTQLDLNELPNGFYALEIHYEDAGNKSAVSYQKVLISR
ncbi:MAG: T9SS type A sorting domain-containing protein, partial [Saprospiraceae bacterium]|nr:T9SS type A sorting domain-containing protein [Saprospiraceae bacterium]